MEIVDHDFYAYFYQDLKHSRITKTLFSSWKKEKRICNNKK